MPSDATRLKKPAGAENIYRTLQSDSDALRESETYVRRRIYGLGDQNARWLLEQYQTAYARMAAAMSEGWGTEDRMLIQRRAQMMAQIEREMQALVQTTQDSILEAQIDGFLQGYAGRAWALDMATNPDVSVTAPLLPREAVRAVVNQQQWPAQWQDTLTLSRDEFLLRVKRGITQSLINGEGIAQAQRRLRDELGIQTNRQQGFKANFYQTLLIARTEIMRASNLGALTIYEQNQDVLSGWEWVASRDERTCTICGKADGKRFKFGDAQMAPPSGSHPGCRCTIVPVLMDEGLMDRVAGVRQTYADWAAQNGMIGNDGGLADQRGDSSPQVNKA